jgi:hypothetical protein
VQRAILSVILKGYTIKIIFVRPTTAHNFSIIVSVIPANSFAQPPFCNADNKMTFSGITFIPNFVNIVNQCLNLKAVLYSVMALG